MKERINVIIPPAFYGRGRGRNEEDVVAVRAAFKMEGYEIISGQNQNLSERRAKKLVSCSPQSPAYNSELRDLLTGQAYVLTLEKEGAVNDIHQLLPPRSAKESREFLSRSDELNRIYGSALRVALIPEIQG